MKSRLCYVCLGLGLVCSNAMSDPGIGSTLSRDIFPARQWATGAEPNYAAAGDLDGDGYPDLAVIAINTDSLLVFFNDRKGGLLPPTTYEIGYRSIPKRLALGDMDGDGDLDVVVTHHRYDLARSLTMFLNDGDGAFPEFRGFDAGFETERIALGDLDGDGDLDVVVESDLNRVYSFFNAGNATLYGRREIQGGLLTVALALGDIDGDGDLDLARGTFGGLDPNNLRVHRNDGLGNFVTEEVYESSGAPHGVAFADLDGDGDLDLAHANESGVVRIRVRLNAGDGTFPIAVDYENPGASAADCGFADLDADGDQDLIVANRGSDSVTIRWNDGAGGLAVVQESGVGDSPMCAVITDFNCDGRLDIIAPNKASSTITLLRNSAQGGIESERMLYAGAQPTGAAVGDLDGDGWEDMVAVNHTDKTVVAWRGFGDGSFQRIGAWATTGQPTGVALADFDGDGLLDAVVSESDTVAVEVFHNSGAGILALDTSLIWTGFANSVVAADFDGDGKPDIATAGSNRIRMCWNDGPLGFSAPEVLATNISPLVIIQDDLDADGLRDIATCNYSSQSITVVRNLGTRAFAPQFNQSITTYPFDIASGDLDGDGDLELFVTTLNSVRVFRNNGDNTYASPERHILPGEPVGIISADFDGDGDSDVIATDEHASRLFFLQNTLGVLEVAGTTGLGYAPRRPLVADFDANGVADLAIVHRNDYSIGVMLRSFRPRKVCPADVDGDAFVTTDDFVVLAGHFGAEVPAGTLGDLNGDGLVNAADFVILAAGFGCGP